MILQLSLQKSVPEITTLCTFPKLEQNYCLLLYSIFHKPASVFVNTSFSVSSGVQRDRDNAVSELSNQQQSTFSRTLVLGYILLSQWNIFFFT